MKTINIEIPVADLKPILPGLAKVVPRKTGLPVLSCVKVSLNADKTLHLQANNLEAVVTARLNKKFTGSSGALLVPFDELTGIAKLCSAKDTIELSATARETFITYPAAGTQVKKSVLHLPLDEFPPATEVNTEPVQLDDAFKQALSQALDCASTDTSRYVITGACLDTSKKEAHYVVGTNGHLLFSANSFLFDVPQSIIVPPGKFLTWAGFMDDGPWTLRFQPEVKGKGKFKGNDQPAWIRLDSDHWTYVSKPIEGAYPNWKQVVPTADSIKSQVTLAEPGIKIILDALSLLPGNDDKDQPVTLEIKENSLTLKARGTASEWTEIPIPAQVAGLPVRISLNRIYLAKALRFGCTQIGILDDIAPLMFSTKGKTMVVCPLRPPAAVVTNASQPNSPPENVAAETPSPAEAPKLTETEERSQSMSANSNTLTAPQRGNLASHAHESEKSPIDEMIEQIGTVREGIKKVLDDLTTTEKLVRKAVKEQKANDKEINRARNALRSLQAVEL